MEPKFIQVGDYVIAVAHVSAVDFSDPTKAEVELDNGRHYAFGGDDLKALRRFFAAPEAPEPGK